MTAGNRLEEMQRHNDRGKISNSTPRVVYTQRGECLHRPVEQTVNDKLFLKAAI